MKIIAFSDWRTQSIPLFLEFLGGMKEKPDIILYAGDDIMRFCRFSFQELPQEAKAEIQEIVEKRFDTPILELIHYYRGVDKTSRFEEIAQLSKKGLCAVAGNDDNPLYNYSISGEKVFDVYKSSFIIDDDYIIIGLEGSVGNIGFNLYSEEEIEDYLLKILEKIGDRKIILVSHAPPYKILDYSLRFGKGHIGSKALRDFIISNSTRIALVVCGHAHLQGGKEQKYQGVPIVNCASHDGKYDSGKVAIIDIQDDGVKITWHFITDHEQNLMRIRNVGYKRAKTLIEFGIMTLEDLCEVPKNHEIVSHSSFKGTFGLIQEYAKAILQNKVLVKTKNISFYKDLKGKNLYFFDAEYDAERTRSGPYGMFVLGWMDMEGNVEQQFLDDSKGEKQMISKFLQWIQKKDAHFIAYASTSADIPHLRNSCERLRLDFSIVKDKMTDIYRNLIWTQSIKRQKIIFPLKDLGLKSLSDYLGYPKTDLEVQHGSMAPFLYAEYLDSEDIEEKKKIKEDLLKYNEDDVKRTAFIFKTIQKEYFT